MKSEKSSYPRPQNYHLDKRADQLIAIGEAAGSAEEEISRAEVARWLGVRELWLLNRERTADLRPCRAIPVGSRVFYRRGDVIRWLRTRQRHAQSHR